MKVYVVSLATNPARGNRLEGTVRDIIPVVDTSMLNGMTAVPNQPHNLPAPYIGGASQRRTLHLCFNWW
ncbi:hypothetical protein F5X99DRAFT_363964 [Biscogniauxia marginata]|nr:hypothetical protein F5X99DRAFT_363964 [Biscogniauxia marginata]